ncbi:N(2)-fixation sustaining protein CowN [Vibrio sp. Y2-5]|nr:N(2)-fixation sustaining protein CowN [Vibrio sp. Y2-5]
MDRDNLNVVENPLNVLYSYFVECDDSDALDLLYKLEQGCC